MAEEREYLELARDREHGQRYVLGFELHRDYAGGWITELRVKDAYGVRDTPMRIDLPSSTPIPPSLQLKPGEGPVRVVVRRWDDEF